MDVLAIIRDAVNGLPDGDHSLGLRSVIRHIDAAVAHLTRGQHSSDDGAFTDAIYRTNQAFEGSVKEAYRVLAERDPAKLSPATIESYLEKGEHLRERVLLQLRRYRQEWRNPSTHDYNLDFDEDEAFLAIVSVSAFAKVLIDQIAERLAFNKAVAEPRPDQIKGPVSVTDAVISAAETVFRSASESSFTESQMLGYFAGHLSRAPGLELTLEPEVKIGSRSTRADVLIRKGARSWVLELKANSQSQNTPSTIAQVMTYAVALNADEGILLLYEPGARRYHVSRAIKLAQKLITMIEPISE